MKYKLTLYQILIALFIVILSYFFWGKAIATSILLGASVAIIPNLIFSFLYFKKSAMGKPQLVIRKFYLGEMIKMIVTIILFIFVFQWQGLIPLPFFLSFSGFLLTHWILLLI